MSVRSAHHAADILARPVQALDGVGPTRARALAQLKIHTLGDLLEYFPRDYQFEASERGIAELRPNEISTARGRVVAVDYVPGRSRPRFEATLQDERGDKLALVWFNSSFLRSRIHPGLLLRVQGKVQIFRNIPSMSQAKWELVDAESEPIAANRFRPVYPATARLSSDQIGDLIDLNLDLGLSGVEEWFDAATLKVRNLMSRGEAYRAIHRPLDYQQAIRARRRLIYDELMLMQLGLGIGKRLRSGRLTAPMMRLDRLLDERIRRRFPFPLTNAQQNAVWQIARDLRAERPMNRLLQGDVGSGKTVVALYAMLVGVANRLQSALLAPTEVLAEQHYFTIGNFLRGSDVKVGLFTGRAKRAARGAELRELADGAIHIAIGTHALLQPDVSFANLGLVVVDEQHKLGVEQRGNLKGKGLSPHYLVMTATPIPRTLALSFFADFDLTTLNELPPGRQPIHTRWLPTTTAEEGYRLIRDEVRAGRQAYVVVPQVHDTGTDTTKSIARELDRLSKGPLASLRLAPLHGQMKTEEKQDAMARFRNGEIDVLVATTVIEVGIDVPNATVMLIDNAESFGLSQLHQLRGRVGRGTETSYCVLISDPTNVTTVERLKAMTQTNDGFEIAEMDLKLRGPGEFFGTRQHGLPEFKLADITGEMVLLQQAKDDAAGLLDADPRLLASKHAALRVAVARQVGDALQLAQIQ